MKFCTNCQRYSPGTPLYCSRCGRTFQVRLCPRGHANGRTVEFCSACGSRDLSMPAPPDDVLARLARGLLMVGLSAVICAALLMIVLTIVAQMNWEVLQGQFVSAAMILGLLYWGYTLLPGPARRAAGTSARLLGKAAKKTAGAISRRSGDRVNRRQR